MKAVVVRAPMQFEVEEVPTPACPEGGMLIQVIACGLCGSDLRTLRVGHRKVTFPWIIGHEVCGDVVAVGAGYQGPWRIGERLAVAPLAYCGACDSCLNGQYELCDELSRDRPGLARRLCRVHGRPGRVCPAGSDPARAGGAGPGLRRNLGADRRLRQRPREGPGRVGRYGGHHRQRAHRLCPRQSGPRSWREQDSISPTLQTTG